jgi:hypothetical protein
MAHRLAYELARGPIPSGYEVDHRCRVRCCVNPDHLAALPEAEHHAKPRVRKFTDAQIAAIRAMRATGARLVDVARAFGVSVTHVSQVARGIRKSPPRRSAP